MYYTTTETLRVKGWLYKDIRRHSLLVWVVVQILWLLCVVFLSQWFTEKVYMLKQTERSDVKPVLACKNYELRLYVTHHQPRVFRQLWEESSSVFSVRTSWQRWRGRWRMENQKKEREWVRLRISNYDSGVKVNCTPKLLGCRVAKHTNPS